MTKIKQLSHFTKLAAAGTLAAAIAAPAAAGSWQKSVSIGGFSAVHIYTPDTVSPVGEGKSLMVVLHGCVQPINNFLTANLEDAAEASGMVIAVPDAANKAGYGCWSYWQGAVSRSSGDYKNLISLANTLSGDASRNIDSDQVYLAGISSGGAFAQQTACLAPDVFKGLAITAGPTLGSGSGGALQSCSGVVSPATYKSRCENYAGTNKSHLSKQIMVTAHAPNDSVVYDCYNEANAEGFAHTYGVTKVAGTTTISEAGTGSAEETLWTDGDFNRAAMLWLPDAVDHAWSGGVGASGEYVSGAGINYATYLGAHFAENNMHVSRDQKPEVSDVAAADSSDRLIISGTATDVDGTVDAVTIQISNVDTGTPQPEEPIITTVDASGQFDITSGALADGLYSISVVATDNANQDSDEIVVTERVGPEPPATAPVLTNTVAVPSALCATVSGTVVDVNQNLSSVTVAFSNGTVAATITGTTYNATQCGLAGGSQTATVTATDATSLSSTASVSFEIDAGSTGDYNHHINEGHISFGDGYSACYLEFGTSAYTMREVASGDQCEWVADDYAACNGPVQDCSTPPQPIDSDNDGVADTVDNCPAVPNTDQADNDNDGEGNVCDDTPDGPLPVDTDGDGVVDSEDNCPNVANADQADDNNNGIGNACEDPISDVDGDGVADADDNCPNIANADQADDNGNGIGNVCEPVIDDCEEVTAANYYHKTGGRAYSSGSYWTPNYYANGSNDAMAGSTWGTTTLKSTDGGTVWNVGTCP